MKWDGGKALTTGTTATTSIIIIIIVIAIVVLILTVQPALFVTECQFKTRPLTAKSGLFP